MEYGMTILCILLILINILLIILIKTYKNNIKYVKTVIENIYDKIEDSRRLVRDIKLYTEDFHRKTSNLVIDVNKIKNNTERLIDYQKTIIIIDKSILKTLNKNINNKSSKVNKSISDVEHWREILDNIRLIKDDVLMLGNDIYNNIIVPAKQRKEIEDFNAKAQGTI